MACQQLGFLDGAKNLTVGSYFGPVTQPIANKGFKCLGNELGLSSCPPGVTTTTTTTKTNCASFGAAGVICKTESYMSEKGATLRYVFVS